MSGRLRITGLLILIFLLIVQASSGATIKVGNGDSNTYYALDNALVAASSGDTILLDNINGTINSTLTAGNITIFNKDLYLDFRNNGSVAGNASIRLNNTIQFSGTHYINFSRPYLKMDLWYDGNIPGTQLNDTLVQFIGSTNLFNSTSYSESTLIINATTFTGTALNITSDSNNINFDEDHGSLYSGHIIGNSYIAVNISGSNNFIDFQYGNGGDINATGIAVNLIGRNNYIELDTDNMLGSLGRLYINNGAINNYIRDNIGNADYPRFSLYNGTSYSSSNKIGYFYNSTWSKSGGNMNVTINVQNLPYSGNTSVYGLYNNVTGNAGELILNSTLHVNSTGVSDGIIFNSTESVIFANTISEVPLKYTFGSNTIRINAVGTFIDEYPLGTVKIINFNPYHSITTMNMNETQTTNWTEFSPAQFAAANPISFVVDNGTVDHKLLGNLTLTQSVNLLDATTISQLENLATKMVITDRNITLDATASSLSAFNKNATLTMYPTFAFSAASDLLLAVTPDGGAATTLWNGSAYTASAPTYLSQNMIDLNITNATRIYTNHFSKFGFSKYTAPVPPVPTTPTAAPGVSTGGSNTNDIAVGVVYNLKAGETAGFKVDKSAVYEVTVTAKDNIQKMMVTVEKKALPKGISSTELKNYEYDQVIIYWADESEISKGTLEFKVSKDWLSKNGYTFADIVMIRYNEEKGVWEELPTEYIREDSNNYIYRATTPGFSYFGIAASEGATIISEDKSIKAVDVVVVKETTEIATPEETTAPAAQETPKATPIGFAPLFAVLISGLLLFIKRK